MQTEEKSTALVWFRNDLRVRDNVVLHAACEMHERVIAVFYLDPRRFDFNSFGFRRTEKFRAKFLLESIAELRGSLIELNIGLMVKLARPEDHLPQLCNSEKVDAIYYQEEWTPEEKSVEQAIKAKLPEQIQYHSYFNQFLCHPDDIGLEIDAIPHVFTEFRKQVERQSEIRPEYYIKARSPENRWEIPNEVLSLIDLGFKKFEQPNHSAFPFKGGEKQALKRLEDYFFETKLLGTYKQTRNGMLGANYSSKLSAWLANGCLSPRTVYWNIVEFENELYSNESTYWLKFELIWRDYFKYISMKHGNAIFQRKGIIEKEYEWRNDYSLVRDWINGQTSSDFVNANMQEIKQTGWMSNRGRQNVASYFSKHLELDWRIGAAYFESMLIDYDVHSNYGNWMYVSGVGNDPRDRVFDIEKQAERYDSDKAFRKTWLAQKPAK